MSTNQTSDVVVSYKGFDKDFSCRGYQFEVGQTYEHDGKVKACAGGFHACEYPLHVLRYYKPNTSRFAVVEQSGTLSRHEDESKIASQRITVKAEIDIAGLIKAAVKYTLDRCKPAEGATSTAANTVVKAEARNESATASGHSGAATASGHYGAATASGYSGAATASGRHGKARGTDGCALFLVHRDADWRITHAKAVIVGKDGVKPDTWYGLDEAGNLQEVGGAA